MHVSIFPLASMAVQVRSIFDLPGHTEPLTRTSRCRIVADAEHSSIAVATPVFDGSVESPHESFLSAGQVIFGAVRSLDVICWMHVDLFPHPSSAVHVRVIEPLQSACAELSFHLKVTEVQLSSAVGNPVS